MSGWTEALKKYSPQIMMAVLVIPTAIYFWSNIKAVWASPKEIEEVRAIVGDSTETQDQISKLVIEQHHRLEKHEAVYSAQMEAMKEQVQLIAELKKDSKKGR